MWRIVVSSGEKESSDSLVASRRPQVRIQTKEKRRGPSPDRNRRLRGHRLGQVLGNLVEEAGGREPLLVGSDQQREVLGHVAGLDGVDTDLLERGREFGEV